MTTFSTQSNTIHIVLRTTSHMNCAFPNDSKRAEDATTTMTIKKKVKGDSIPYFPANGLRGAFRRSIADRVLNGLGKPVTTEIYLGLMSGSSPTGLDSVPNSIEELMRSALHPYMGVFGGGSRMLVSRYAVSDINPIIQSTIENRVVQAPQELTSDILGTQVRSSNGDVTTLQAYQLTEKRAYFKIDDISRGRNMTDITHKVEGGEDAISAHLKAVAEEQLTRKTQKKEVGGEVDKKKQISNILAVEAICPGVDMHFRIDLSPEMSEEQIGVVLLALEDFADKNYLGGWGRIGFGRFEITTVDVNIPAHDIRETVNDGLYNNEKFTLNNSRLRLLTEQAQEGINAIDVEEIIDYFTPRKAKA